MAAQCGGSAPVRKGGLSATITPPADGDAGPAPDADALAQPEGGQRHGQQRRGEPIAVASASGR
jgi:hypothetical protein